ncbi:menaquinone-specific isochorismate synthase [Saccharopolyspora antimicrobica]|uniref:isochorismate synthase n=1 Tax=Saccharopolyspora antimicrobica TaxID=455193 RepID=A0A1I5DVP9_9PSEU|nr:isochorismate synthase [Saccharopolyspora antimicrobica]SFO03278.1 menaquinone-specific isochorismate synthase [Saccharopolyspora antimicrobica]
MLDPVTESAAFGTTASLATVTDCKCRALATPHGFGVGHHFGPGAYPPGVATTSRPLVARSRRLEPGDPRHDRPLLELLPGGSALSWVRDGAGLVGWGCAARLEVSGPDRFERADAWWQQLCERAEVVDQVGLPGSGPVAFASMAFADHPGHSALVVPEVVVGERDGVRWITTIGDGTAEADEPEPVRPPGIISYSDGQLSATGYRQAVAEAVGRMQEPGGLAKVVLAHDLLATTSEPLDMRFLLHNLAARYPSCWTFAVDGLIGATPELLLERTGYEVRSRVLAGTIWPREGHSTEQLAAELLSSAKNRHEHAYAAESLAVRLRPFCSDLVAPDEPEVLQLRNVLHLATNVEGKLSDADGRAATLLRLAAAVHPTAAVGGTPTEDAVRLISELEGMDRGRYAGPVGWLDGSGNGELGVALRCAQVEDAAAPGGETGRSGGKLRLFAGCGIVPDSDPDLEVAEAEAKLLPVREALEGLH